MSEETVGDKRLNEIKQLLTEHNNKHNIPVDVQDEQQRFIHAHLHHIYGEEWERVRQRVLSEHKIEELKDEFTSSKLNDRSIPILVAIMLRTIPEFRIVIITTGWIQARYINVKIALCLEPVKERIITHNMEEICIAPQYLDLSKTKKKTGTSSVFISPPNCNLLRGQYADCMIVIE